MNCINCQAEIIDGLKFCGNCGAKIENTQLVSKNQEVVKFQSMEELTSFLNNKSQTYKGALAKVLTSQIEVLRSVQSPELSSLTFDLLLDNLHMAIQESESKVEKTEIQQKFSLMINAYVFFSQAKIEAASATNKRDADALLATGASIMAKSVTAVVQFAITRRADISTIVEIGDNVFGSTPGKSSFIERVVTWWRKDVRIKESRQAFMSTVNILVDKLNDDRALIGPSRIIHGFVKQYAPSLIDIKMAHLYNKQAEVKVAYDKFSENITEANNNLVIALWWVLGVNAVVYAVLLAIWLLTFWVSFIIDWSAGDWVKSYNYISVGSIAVYGAVAVIIFIINSLRRLIEKKKTKLLFNEINEKINIAKTELNSYYGDILQYFKN